jgi:hypothetical protein
VGTDHELKVGVGVNLFGFGGYKASDAPILNGMENRRQGIFMGPAAKWSPPVRQRDRRVDVRSYSWATCNVSADDGARPTPPHRIRAINGSDA